MRIRITSNATFTSILRIIFANKFVFLITTKFLSAFKFNYRLTSKICIVITEELSLAAIFNSVTCKILFT
jgi:hypothetical protein